MSRNASNLRVLVSSCVGRSAGSPSLVVIAGAALLLAFGCTKDVTTQDGCSPAGLVVSCTCPDNSDGTRECLSDSTFGECRCASSPDGGNGDTGQSDVGETDVGQDTTTGRQVEIQFIHAAPNVPEVDIYVTGEDTALTTYFEFLDVSEEDNVEPIDGSIEVYEAEDRTTRIDTGLEFAEDAVDLFLILVPDGDDEVSILDVDDDQEPPGDTLVSVLIVNGLEHELTSFVFEENAGGGMATSAAAIAAWEQSDGVQVPSGSGSYDFEVTHGTDVTSFDVGVLDQNLLYLIILFGDPTLGATVEGRLRCVVFEVDGAATEAPRN